MMMNTKSSLKWRDNNIRKSGLTQYISYKATQDLLRKNNKQRIVTKGPKPLNNIQLRQRDVEDDSLNFEVLESCFYQKNWAFLEVSNHLSVDKLSLTSIF